MQHVESVKCTEENSAKQSPPLQETQTRYRKHFPPATYAHHPNYPIPIRDLPPTISQLLANLSRTTPPKAITDKPHLDLLYFQPFLPSSLARDLFRFLRSELPFYRVKYTIRRGPAETSIVTPRFTTVFGVDDTSIFIPDPNSKIPDETNATATSSLILADSKTRIPLPASDKKYHQRPRPIPPCLDLLRRAVESSTDDGTKYNFVLVNYYATGDDSITYHSDDERFLGSNPNIASISLGGKRDFLLKHKPPTGSDADGIEGMKPLKFPLDSGDMMVMRGETQSNWLHSVPKRKGGQGVLGRINITFRRAVVPGGTNNYYLYNVGDGGIFRWKEDEGRMIAAEKPVET
ncbi:DNA repair family protein [Aspergillus heteromorphus CBS 117.55]|uniref:DNA repair family protein n=1 Tax=Aspergillus heteromorphus CBS 117.55 TaxID=1448321 RepID=A0A317W236_9EURO|nr:DNA repair family protein [Aspergillus heteromorphus CBS 117.55]PWY79332.1 DNA repair family protein [Aspergillus heteromorphus CBS 117.55]